MSDTADQLAELVVAYANAYGLHISQEANDLWDACEGVLGNVISTPRFRTPTSKPLHPPRDPSNRSA